MISGPFSTEPRQEEVRRGIGPKAWIVGDIRREFCILPLAPLREPRANAAKTGNRSPGGMDHERQGSP
jgi:hypothetical protein